MTFLPRNDDVILRGNNLYTESIFCFIFRTWTILKTTFNPTEHQVMARLYKKIEKGQNCSNHVSFGAGLA